MLNIAQYLVDVLRKIEGIAYFNGKAFETFKIVIKI